MDDFRSGLRTIGIATLVIVLITTGTIALLSDHFDRYSGTGNRSGGIHVRVTVHPYAGHDSR